MPARRNRRNARWTEAHVRRLFWRAGFGATPTQARRFADAGKVRTLRHMLDTRPKDRLAGPEPTADGKALDPVNEYGHDVLWWLDRMVRSERPLREKMTLFWTDHFSVAGQDAPLMLATNRTLRAHALGSFPRMLKAVTTDPAMLLFLSLADSDKESPNENYPRELMELFTLGRGYSEQDVREVARAMTGFKSKWDDGFRGISYELERHDPGTKKIFGRRGAHDWRDVLRMVCAHPAHARFMVEKLWAYFVATPIPRRTRAELVRTYRRSGLRLRPVVSDILAHPALYRDLDRPDMVKAPVVFLAGALRATGQGVQSDSWTWLLNQMGQHPFEPPSVAGWDGGPAWLSTNTMGARFQCVNYVLRDGPAQVPDKVMPIGLTPAEHVRRARRATGSPWISRATAATLARMADSFFTGEKEWERQTRADHCQRALRHFLLSGPDAQLH